MAGAKKKGRVKSSFAKGKKKKEGVVRGKNGFWGQASKGGMERKAPSQKRYGKLSLPEGNARKGTKKERWEKNRRKSKSITRNGTRGGENSSEKKHSTATALLTWVLKKKKTKYPEKRTSGGGEDPKRVRRGK